MALAPSHFFLTSDLVIKQMVYDDIECSSNSQDEHGANQRSPLLEITPNPGWTSWPLKSRKTCTLPFQHRRKGCQEWILVTSHVAGRHDRSTEEGPESSKSAGLKDCCPKLEVRDNSPECKRWYVCVCIHIHIYAYMYTYYYIVILSQSIYMCNQCKI